MHIVRYIKELTEWLGLTEAGIKVFVDNDWNEKGMAAPGQGIMGMLAFCEEILKEKFSLARLQCFIYCRRGQRFVRRHLCCWMLDVLFYMALLISK